ncbi:MAG: OsmC family protein [Chloroflexi bacterium]|nr:OsmC family protein [Chloroflexota bacterium]
MAKVEAEFLEGERVVFTARGRSTVNARAALPDGPVGYNSGELLLIALANCSLGVLTNHELLQDVPIRNLRAVVECDSLKNPSRMDNIRIVIELEVDDPALLERQGTLERVAGSCPVGNTLRSMPQINVELRITAPQAAAEVEAVTG